MKVDETKTRSFLKSGSTRIVEITIDTSIFYIIGIPIWEGLPLSIGLELLCFGICYVSERLWNKLQWGRKITND